MTNQMYINHNCYCPVMLFVVVGMRCMGKSHPGLDETILLTYFPTVVVERLLRITWIHCCTSLSLPYFFFSTRIVNCFNESLGFRQSGFLVARFLRSGGTYLVTMVSMHLCGWLVALLWPLAKFFEIKKPHYISKNSKTKKVYQDILLIFGPPFKPPPLLF